MQTAYINRVATAVPPYDVHDAFRRFARSLLSDDRRDSLLFQRMADKSGIEHRYSCALDSFHAVLVPGTRGLITWNIREAGFDMALSGPRRNP